MTVALLHNNKNYTDILKYYGQEFCDFHLEQLDLGDTKKVSSKLIIEVLEDIIPNLRESGIKLLIVTHPEYFKKLTKQTKSDITIGTILDTKYEGIQATYCPNYSRIFYDPINIKDKITLCQNVVTKWLNKDYVTLGANVIKHCCYPNTDNDIKNHLQTLIDFNNKIAV